ncbi:copia protein [Tanacetum coccineum]
MRNVETEVDNDQEEAEMKKAYEKSSQEGKDGIFQIIRADGSSKRYSSMIQMLQNIDREDLETLWKLVKAKHGLTRPEEGYERVLWESAYLYAGRKEISTYTCNNHINAQQEASWDHGLNVVISFLKLMFKTSQESLKCLNAIPF